jgi:hypothetical protein
MILLITPSSHGEQCASALEAMAKEKVQLVSTLKRGLAFLRGGEFSIVILDECLLDLNPGEGDLLLRRAGTAMPVYINLGISGVDRVVQQVKAAIRRRSEERMLAFRAAEAHLRSELRSDLTALLLSADMAVAEPLPEPTLAKLNSVRQLLARMRSRLQLS